MTPIIILMTIFASGLHMTSGDTNNKWQPNDNILRAIDDYYFELVSHTHVYSQRQRYLSVVSLALSFYITNRENLPNPQRVHDAVEKTKALLNNRTEAISSALTTLLVLLRSIIDKPINDVKESCPPNVGQIACEESLQKVHAKNEQYCREYLRNIRHYDEIVDLFNDKQIPELTMEINTTKKNSDDDALQFFSSAANGKYSKLIKRMRDQFQRQIHTSYPCNALNVPAFESGIPSS